MDAISQIEKIKTKQQSLMHDLNKAVEKAFPVGAIVDFYKGRGWRSVEIISMSKAFSRGDDPHFTVRNIHTGVEYQIDLYWLMNKNPA